MNFIFTIIAFILIIGFLVFIHELGHFMAARLMKVDVKEFAIGFGPSLFKRKFNNTIYKLNLIPLGGYVQLEGEHDINAPNGFRSKSFPAKFFILIGGVFMNTLGAIILLGIYLHLNNNVFVFQNLVDYGFSNTDQQYSLYPILLSEGDSTFSWDKFQSEDINLLVGINDKFFKTEVNFVNDVVNPNLNKDVVFNVLDSETLEIQEIKGHMGGLYDGKYVLLHIDEVKEGGRSDGYLKQDDLVVGIAEELFKSPSDFKKLLDKVINSETTFQILSKDNNTIENRKINIGNKDEKGIILDVSNYFEYGINYEETPQTYFVKYKDNLISPFSITYDLSIYQFKILANLINNAVDKGEISELSNAVGGPVKVGAEVNTLIKYQSFETFIPLIALISLSLAIFNVLPIPALDGGQITLAFIEMLRRKPIPDSIVNKINFAGFVILIGLSIMIFVKDLVEIF